MKILLNKFKDEENEDKKERELTCLHLLMSNRDRAADEMEKYEEKVRKATGRKRARLVKQFKQRKREWIQLEKQVSEHAGTPFDENDYMSDESFLYES